jgi:hypothetical protein
MDDAKKCPHAHAAATDEEIRAWISAAKDALTATGDAPKPSDKALVRKVMQIAGGKVNPVRVEALVIMDRIITDVDMAVLAAMGSTFRMVRYEKPDAAE